ncbi:hypothetical protein PsorP6_002014 [Peronosclerospora sorghi]|uniref:Uncharacterized protein n=1 Tax=Peronosclerospora sorghi TaxID=230839 RepID=A0ACC0WZV6_9STRA|nr:hypothetical protein PsorP6_002014 [Peronosclerospora sorghi]
MQNRAAQRTECRKGDALQQVAEEAATQKVLQHYAKTVYFNDLWMSFLSKMSGLVALMCVIEVQRMRQRQQGISFVEGFEALSFLIGASTVFFIRRWMNPLLAFKVAFAFSLLQGFWFVASYASRLMQQPRQAGDLFPEQLPFGLLYFVVCWISDRFMMRSQDLAKQTADDLCAYRDDPAWADVVKVPQDDGPDPISFACSVPYCFVFSSFPPPVTDIMDCFRGVLKTNEYSERTLSLTKDVIQVNPANYTVWYFRRRILAALGSDLHAELAFTATLAREHSKNYQIWNYRREICTMMQDGSHEKTLCAMVFQDDAKNYHAWSHRQWVVKTFNLWDGELAFVDKMLLDDVRNNSAWNHRWFVVSRTARLETTEGREREVHYALDKLALAVHNESAWNYLRGLFRGHEAAVGAQVKDKAREILKASPDCIFAAALLVDLYVKEATEEALEEAQDLIKTLMNDTDCVRKTYWQFRLSTLRLPSRVVPSTVD